MKQMKRLTEFEAERVWLAPLSGATDAAFRREVGKVGCKGVVSEMVAGEALTMNRPDVVRRTCRHDGEGLWVVQLAARNPEHMKTASALLVELGVDVIDINMGCPSRQVTGGRSGSALMREPELAMRIVDAAIEGADGKPVTLKMRLGWDDSLLNAPELAQQAAGRGVVMITVHGRTRCQFYKGEANWRAIADTVGAIDVPVIANGDISGMETARAALQQSGAYGVMIGRAAMGAPWLPAQIAANLEGAEYQIPNLHEQASSLCEQVEDSVSLYGHELGLKMVRKHVAAAIDAVDLSLPADVRRELRSQFCQIIEAGSLQRAIESLYHENDFEAAA